MKHRYAILLLLLLHPTILLYGQCCKEQHRCQKCMEVCRPQEKWWHSDHFLFRAQETSKAAALIPHLLYAPSSQAGVLFSGGRKTPVQLPTYPTTEGSMRFFAEGSKRLGRYYLVGEAHYERGKWKELSHTLSDDPELFYPFLVADTVPKTLTLEQYGASFQAGYFLSSWLQLGLSAGYEGKIRYSRTDPRVQNTTSTPSVGLSLTLNPSKKWGLFSLSSFSSFYAQQLRFHILTPSSSEQIYVLRPMGAFNLRASGRETAEEYRHKREAHTLGLQWASLQREWLLGVQYKITNGRLETREAGVFLNQLASQALRSYFYAQLFQIQGGHEVALSGEYLWQNNIGKERTYERVEAKKGTGLTRSELVAEHTTYSELRQSWNASLRYKFKGVSRKIELAVTMEQKQHHGETQDGLGYNHLALTSLSPALALSWRGKGQRSLYGSFRLSSLHKVSEDSDIQLGHDQKSGVIELARATYWRGPSHTLSAGGDLFVPLFSGSHALKLSLDITPQLWSSGQKIVSGTCAISYIF